MKHLSEIRKKRGLTQAELAEIVNIGVNSIARYERGEIKPSIDAANAIAKALGVTVEELLNGSAGDKVEIMLSWNWEDMKKGEINMGENKFKLILGDDGMIGLHGAGKVTSREAIEEFLGRIRNELEIALDAQIRRGVIPQEA